MSARLHQRGFSYEVALPGEFRPAYLVAFADMGVRHAVSSSVFLMPVQNGKGIPEIAAMLQERGLVILHIRRVTSPGTTEGAAPESAPRRRPVAPTLPAGPLLSSGLGTPRARRAPSPRGRRGR